MLGQRFIHRIITLKESIKPLNQRSASLFLTLLICGDLVFVVLHFMNVLIHSLKNNLLSLEVDKGYPEMYQYLKFLWIIIVIIFIALKDASLHYVSWVLIFAYFLLDDSLQVHENVGYYISENLSFAPILGLRLQDFGELAVSCAAGIILLLPLIFAYVKGSNRFRKISQDLTFLIFVLLFFGVVVDMAHIAIQLGDRVHFAIGAIEDGGEMLSVSLILWYIFLIQNIFNRN